jgi:polar amino acid transport system permease protein
MSGLDQPLGMLPFLLDGLWVTLALTLGGTLVAALSAFGAGLARLSRHWPVCALAALYVDLFRGTSALVQLFWVFFVLPEFGLRLSPPAGESGVVPADRPVGEALWQSLSGKRR